MSVENQQFIHALIQNQLIGNNKGDFHKNITQFDQSYFTTLRRVAFQLVNPKFIRKADAAKGSNKIPFLC